MHIIRRPAWARPEREVTPEAIFWNRRSVLAALGGGAALALAGGGRADAAPGDPFTPKPPRNPAYADAGRPVTPLDITGKYNNYYEFGSHKQIWHDAQEIEVDPWTVEVDGKVARPQKIGVEDLIAKMPVEERVYRHRCVEAWSMVVPWVGFPLAALVKMAEPTADAKYVRFETFNRPEVARGQRQFWYPWPYVEGLTMAEATNDLPLMVVGAYGQVLPKQFGAPLRLHLPWKYGFKSIKGIVKVTFTDERPVGFWENLQASEYGFWANVNPEVDHPRWSQAEERDLTTGDKIPTQKWNGYGEQVAHIYDGLEAEFGDRLYR